MKAIQHERIINSEAVGRAHTIWRFCKFVACIFTDEPGQEFYKCEFIHCKNIPNSQIKKA